MYNLLLERDDWFIRGVKQRATVVEAENGALHLKHDVAVNVRDGKGAFRKGH